MRSAAVTDLFVEENDNLQMEGFVYIVLFLAEGTLSVKNNGDCFCFVGLLGLDLSTWHLVPRYVGHEADYCPCFLTDNTFCAVLRREPFLVVLWDFCETITGVDF